MVTKANTGTATRTVDLARHFGSDNVINYLAMAPCCGHPSRRNLCRRFGTVTRRASLPRVLCGIPSHANYSLLPRAINHLTGMGGVVKVGRTAKGLAHMGRVGRLISSSFILLDNSSTDTLSFVRLNNRKIVSIATGITTHSVTRVYGLTTRKRFTRTHIVGRHLVPLRGGLFIRPGPVPIG